MAKIKNPKQKRESIAEFTFKSVASGTILGVLFGAANTYLGLRVGLTVSTAIPISVLSVALFKLGRPLWGPSTLLETNMSQTIGSASSSVASGVIFTVPALFLWGLVPHWVQIGVLGLLGGILGTLAMVPLRRLLIVDSRDELPYPEGTACAQVLKAGDKGLAHSKWIFIGLIAGALIKLSFSLLSLAPSELGLDIPFLQKAHLSLEVSAALLAVGYILGYKQAAVMISGSLISWLVLIPLIAQIGGGLTTPVFPETTTLISAMSASQIWSKYIRYIGAGAVAAAGIVTVIRTFPTLVQSVERIWKSTKQGQVSVSNAALERTDQDVSGKLIIWGVVGVILILAFVPGIFGGEMGFTARVISAVGCAFFGLLFVAVSARIVGLIGVSSNPTSGMTIVTLLGVSAVFAFLGWSDPSARAVVLTVGSIVAIAASIAGDTAQDLKAGYLVGATPAKQQYGQLIGVATACWAIAATMLVLSQAYGFGSKELPAPQATLMRTVIDGVLSGALPWNFVFTGSALSLVAILSGLAGLPFAIGIYLPLATLSPIFVGGLLRKILTKRNKKLDEDSESDPGILCASGLIAGEGIAGVVIAGIAAFTGKKPGGDMILNGMPGTLMTIAILLVILQLLRKSALSKLKA